MLKSLRYGKEFEELYTGNYSRLYYYAYQFLNDAEVSRDVVNDAFEYVWKNYENFRKMNVVAILFQSVRNKSIDTFRHNKVEENYVALYSRMLSEEDAGLDEAAQKIVFTKEELSRNSGKPCYILEFYTDKCAYSYKVDAVSGDIIGKKTDWFSRQESETVPTERQKPDSKQRTDD